MGPDRNMGIGFLEAGCDPAFAGCPGRGRRRAVRLSARPAQRLLAAGATTAARDCQLSLFKVNASLWWQSANHQAERE